MKYMSKLKVTDLIIIALSGLLLYMAQLSPSFDATAQGTVYYVAIILLVVTIIGTIAGFTQKGKRLSTLAASISIFLPLIVVFGLIQGKIDAVEGIWDEIPFFAGFDYLPFAYHVMFAFITILTFFTAIVRAENGLLVLITVPIVIVALSAQFIVFMIDLIFPPKVQELMPYIDALKMLFVNIANTMSDPARLQTELALQSLGNLTGAVEDISEGYALRKSLGQGIDLGLTFIVFVLLGGFAILEERLGLSRQVIVIFFASLGLALATFSGIFGPFYGLAEAAKEFSLKHGNYRGAAFYKSIEQLFAIPFMAASAGFLFLDLPPVDGDTLDEFKKEMQEQISDLTDNINSLLGKNASAVPRKTRKMIAAMMNDTEDNLAKLDFRDMRKETARQFALSYYQHEFSWRPWKRKTAVKEFSNNNYFDYETGEDTLKLIGYKIEAGQMDDDMVNNVMITASLRGIIMMEEKFQNMLSSVELGQTCTGLAFGARQFLEDHYVVRSRQGKILDLLRNLTLGIFAVPIVLVISLKSYANRIFDIIGDSFWNQQIIELTSIRYIEITSTLKGIPAKIRKTRQKKPKSKEEKQEVKKKRQWKIRRKLTVTMYKIAEVFWFPFKILIGLGRFVYTKLRPSEASPRDQFEEAVAHAALVAMYGELYNKLVKQDHVTTAF